MAATYSSLKQAVRERRKLTKPRHTTALMTAGVMALAAAYPAMAADVTWTGPGGTADDGGSWETPGNWSAGIPVTTSNAILGNVTAGDRVITLDAAGTINQLSMTQTTAGGTNTLTLNDNLTISGSDNPFAISAVTPASVILNIASGKTLTVANAGGSLKSMNADFGGTLNLAANATATFVRADSSNDVAPIRFGAINASGAGAKIDLSATRYLGRVGNDLNTSHSFVTFGSTTVNTAASLSLNGTGMNGSNRVDSFSRVAHFNGDDGSGNAVRVNTGGVLNLNIGGIYSFDNRVNLAPNAKMSFGVPVQGGANLTATFANGSLLEGDAYPGNALTLQGGSVVATFAGSNHWQERSKVILRYTGNSGAGQAFITGDLTQDGAALTFFWDSAGSLNGARNWNNSGTWTLQNNGRVNIDGFSFSLSAFSQLVGNVNSGTMSILSSSSVVARDVTNTGTLNLDSGTLGAVSANHSAFVLKNNSGGIVNVTGTDWSIAGGSVITEAGSNNATLINGDVGTGSSVVVGTGLDTPTFILRGANTQFTNNAGNTTTIATGATLWLDTLDSHDIPTRYQTTYFTNGGTTSLGGTIQFRPNHRGPSAGANNATTTNTGTFIISGSGAVIERLYSHSTSYRATTTGQSGNNAVFLNQTGATFQGSGVHDVLTYVNDTGVTTEAGGQTFLTMTNSGTIDPGNGHDGAGLSSVGKLTLVNTSVAFSGGVLNIDLGGSSLLSSTYDNLTLSGDGATFLLGGGDTLNIIAVNGATPMGTYDILDALSLTGTFDTLLFNGAPVNGAYTVNYRTDGADVIFVPEPASLGFLTIGLLAMTRRRRSI